MHTQNDACSNANVHIVILIVLFAYETGIILQRLHNAHMMVMANVLAFLAHVRQNYSHEAKI